MKRTIVLGLILFGFLNVLQAQEGFHFGLKVNPVISFSTAVKDSTGEAIPDVAEAPRLGYEFGVAMTYGFSEKFSLGFGAEVVNRGFNFKQNSTNPFDSSVVEFKAKQTFTTLEIPIYFKARSGEIGSGIHLAGNFGASADVNISNRFITDGWETTTDSLGAITGANQIELITNDPKRMNLVTVTPFVGLGVDWENNWGTINIMASYHHGVLSAWNRKETGATAAVSYVALDLAYFF